MQHTEAIIRGASRAARGSTGTLAAPGAGKKRRGMRRHPVQERSGLHTVYGSRQPAQDIVDESDMDGKRILSAQ
jgi:hypothetical protein